MFHSVVQLVFQKLNHNPVMSLDKKKKAKQISLGVNKQPQRRLNLNVIERFLRYNNSLFYSSLEVIVHLTVKFIVS